MYLKNILRITVCYWIYVSVGRRFRFCAIMYIQCLSISGWWFQQNKTVIYWYRTPQVLHCIYPTVPDKCWLLHIFWAYPVIYHFWTQVKSIMQKTTEDHIPDKPSFFLLHLSPSSHKQFRKSLIRHLVNPATSCIPSMWKQPHPPSIYMWTRKVEGIQKIKDLILLTQTDTILTKIRAISGLTSDFLGGRQGTSRRDS